MKATKKDNQKLLEASISGNIAEVKALLALVGINTTTDFQQALQLAAAHGHTKIVELLLNKGANIESTWGYYSQTALHFAAENGHIETFKFLLQRGADINATNRDGFLAIHCASSHGRINILEFMLDNVDNKLDIETENYLGKTPIHVAAEHGHTKTVQFLLDRGANLNAKICPELPELGLSSKNRTALHVAAAKGHTKTVALLLNKGAQIEEMDGNGYTPLLLATLYGWYSTIKCLLDRGANINAQSSNGDTSLHCILRSSSGTINNKVRLVILSLLVISGLDINIKNNKGEKAIYFVNELNRNTVPHWKQIWNILNSENPREEAIKALTMCFIEAIKDNSLKFAIGLFKLGYIDFNFKDEQKRTILEIAASNNNDVICSLIILSDLYKTNELTEGTRLLIQNSKESAIKCLLEYNKKNLEYLPLISKKFYIPNSGLLDENLVQIMKYIVGEDLLLTQDKNANISILTALYNEYLSHGRTDYIIDVTMISQSPTQDQNQDIGSREGNFVSRSQDKQANRSSLPER